MDQLSDNVIEYQLSKVDQGGEVQELFEARMSELSAAWGYPIEANEDHPNFGDIRLPDGRYVTFTYGVEFMDAPDRDAPRGAPGCTCGTPPFSPPEPDPSCPFHGEAS